MKSAFRNPHSAIPMGPACRRALARDLVALLDQDMQYIGWFAAVARTYPDDAPAMDWPRAMEIARAALMPLRVAEALLSRAHRTPRDIRTPEQITTLRAAKHLARRGPVGPRLSRHR